MGVHLPRPQCWGLAPDHPEILGMFRSRLLSAACLHFRAKPEFISPGCGVWNFFKSLGFATDLFPLLMSLARYARLSEATVQQPDFAVIEVLWREWHLFS